MKVVIDTNILVSAAQDENSMAWKIIREVIEGRLEAFATHQTMSENRQMLRKLIRDRQYRELLEEYFRRLLIVKVFKPVQVVSDPEDNKLFESAVASGADYIITNDGDVLYVEEFKGVKVVTPEEFWAKYKEDDDSAWQDWSKMLMGN